jgi:CBS domain-containing protein
MFASAPEGNGQGMTDTIRELMTRDPTCVDESAPLREVATLMRDRDLGDVLVQHDGRVDGIVTDRDIVLRAVAGGGDMNALHAGDICSHDLVTLQPDDTLEAAAQIMVDAAVRRVPVMDGDQAVGIVALADLARYADSESVLGEIASQPPKN